MEQEERPPIDSKQLKCMKKKLDELNRKIRHSRKNHNNLVSKRNSLRRAIEELKRGVRQTPERMRGFVELERAFQRAYRRYRVNGRSGMDADTFFERIKENSLA